MIGAGERRVLAALVVPRVGWLEPAGDTWEPWRLCDPAGAVVVPVAAYLRDLQAAGRPETTLRTYSIALLRWFRPINCTMSLIFSQADRLVSQRSMVWCRFGGYVGRRTRESRLRGLPRSYFLWLARTPGS
jgi:hypothetical protein